MKLIGKNPNTSKKGSILLVQTSLTPGVTNSVTHDMSHSHILYLNPDFQRMRL